MFEKLITNFFKYQSEWEFINSKNLQKGKFIKKSQFVQKNKINELVIKSQKKIIPGWYLFVIKYSSKDVKINLDISI